MRQTDPKKMTLPGDEVGTTADMLARGHELAILSQENSALSKELEDKAEWILSLERKLIQAETKLREEKTKLREEKMRANGLEGDKRTLTALTDLIERLDYSDLPTHWAYSLYCEECEEADAIRTAPDMPCAQCISNSEGDY